MTRHLFDRSRAFARGAGRLVADRARARGPHLGLGCQRPDRPCVPRPRPRTTPAPAPAEEERDDAVLNRSQPDFTLINLPTGLRLPKWKSAFRVTHRFTRPLGDGDFGDLAEDFFGLDSGAIIGLEFRIGVAPGTQVGVHRTNDRTIQFFGQYDVKQQSDSFPLGIAAYATIDGTDNFTDSYSPSLGAILTREFGEHGAIHVEPIWVNNTNQLPSEVVDDNDTFLLGIGGRIRIRPTVYVVAEIVPRLSGFDPGSTAPASRSRSAPAATRSSWCSRTVSG